ncbi:MAG: 30S ribosome-binding factor RbfA [Lachnospiraceae bacterium]|nr:30S ribosome-binding factor RbfA [Lachnospiraceae bacterium]
MRKNSVKNTRIDMEVQRELAQIIRELKDPRIAEMTSITEVSVTPDLKQCKAYISVLGSDEELKQTMDGLKSAEGFVRRELARRINLRNTPEIRFIGDGSIAYGVDMAHKIDEVIARDNAARPAEAESDDGGSSED